METTQQRFERAKQVLVLNGPRLARLKAQTVLALVVLRIQSQGLPGKHYSPSLVPTYFFTKQALNAGGRAYIKKNRLGNWAGLRAAEGLPVDAVYLTHRGRTLRSLVATDGAGSGGVFTARIVASDAESARIVSYNMDRYGNFLLPLPAEAAEADAAVAAEITRLMKGVFQS